MTDRKRYDAIDGTHRDDLEPLHHAVMDSLDDWFQTHYGPVLPDHHHAGLFLRKLEERGYAVVRKVRPVD